MTNISVGLLLLSSDEVMVVKMWDLGHICTGERYLNATIIAYFEHVNYQIYFTVNLAKLIK